MFSGASGVGEVRVMPDLLHAFTMAICRADGSSAEEARLVADRYGPQRLRVRFG
jgi:uncharacterized oxidoreductase